MNRLSFFFCGILLLLPFFAYSGEENSENWVLLEGESKELEVGQFPLATIDHPDVVLLKHHSQTKVTVEGLKKGQTQIRFHGRDGKEKIVRLHITSRQLYKQYQEIRHLLQGIHGLKLSLTRNEVVIEGELLLPGDVKKVDAIKAQYEDVINLTTFNKELYQTVTARYLHSKLDAPTITVKIKDRFLILEGSLPSASEIKKIEGRARMLAKISDTRLELKSLLDVKAANIDLEITFMQINQLNGEKAGVNVLESLKALGSLNWNGPGTPSSNLATNAEAQINALVENAWGDVVHKTTKKVNSGSELRFQDGDDLVIPGNENNKTTRVNTGLIIKATPTLHSNGEIDLKVSFEVSAPTPGSGASIQVTRFLQETEVICQMGQTLILSQLLSSIKRKFKKQTPVLGAIPILNILFSNEAKSESQKDLLLLVTPKAPGFKRDLVKAKHRFQSLREMLQR